MLRMVRSQRRETVTSASPHGWLALLLFLGFGGNAFAAPDELVFAATRQGGDALLWIAADQGYFKAQGLDLRIEAFPSEVRALQALETGEAQFASASGVAFLNALHQHSDLRLMAMFAAADDRFRVIVRKDRGIRSPADLEGKRAGVPPASPAAYFFNSLLLLHYLPSQSVERYEAVGESLPRALVSGRVDAIVVPFELARQADRLSDGELLEFTAPELYRPTYNLITRAAVADSNPQLLDALLRALLQAEVLANEDPERARRIVRRQAGVTDWDHLSFNLVLDQDLLMQLQREEQWLERQLSRSQLPRRLLDYIYTDALARVAPDRNAVMR